MRCARSTLGRSRRRKVVDEATQSQPAPLLQCNRRSGDYETGLQ
ncbi:hypothetical protein LG3211_3202 [Lysobacter gummosus]|nr:hypothetical protein LG3211_3202 [Lysobacter gummosus]